MKVLWITNMPFSHHYDLLHRTAGAISSGSWLYAAYESSLNCSNIELHIATVSNVINTVSGKYDNNYFHILPGGDMLNYGCTSEENLKHWKGLKDEINPDIVLIWGTESKFAYTATKAFKEKKVVVFIQGVLNSIVDHFFDGIPFKYRCCTPRDFAGYLTGKDSYPILKKSLGCENYVLENAHGVIVENDWCESQCRAINPRLQIYQCYLPIRQEFYERRWSLDKVERNSIFTNAGGSTFKGHHILFQALAIVKKTYPDVKCYIPGANYIEYKKCFTRRTGYFSWLMKIYKENNLQENILFTGTLSPAEMADYLANKHIYVMPSTAENHSSSLIEAMIVGAPCISSLVGGTGGLIHTGVNGVLYNSLEAKTLAGSILKLFSDDRLTQRYAKENSAYSQRRKRDFGNSILEIYKQISVK